MKSKSKQIIAVIALFAFLFFTVFSAVGLVISVSHTCVGIHCRCCERISAVQEAVHILKCAVIALLAVLFVRETVKMLVAKMPPAFYYDTVVTLKTKLSN